MKIKKKSVGDGQFGGGGGGGSGFEGGCERRIEVFVKIHKKKKMRGGGGGGGGGVSGWGVQGGCE